MSPISNPASMLIVALMVMQSLSNISLVETQQTEYQLDTNHRSETVLVQTIKLKNTSDSPITIENINCDNKVCKILDWRKGLIPPNKTGFIKIAHHNIPLFAGSESMIDIFVILKTKNNDNDQEDTLKIKIKREVREFE